MELTPIEWMVLDDIRTVGVDIRKVSEGYCQVIIALSTTKPPLVDASSDKVLITDAGRAALKAQPNY